MASIQDFIDQLRLQNLMPPSAMAGAGGAGSALGSQSTDGEPTLDQIRQSVLPQGPITSIGSPSDTMPPSMNTPTPQDIQNAQNAQYADAQAKAAQEGIGTAADLEQGIPPHIPPSLAGVGGFGSSGLDPSEIAQLQKIYPMQNMATQQLMQQLANMPQRPQPGVMARVLSSIAGLSGLSPMGIAHGQVVGITNDPKKQYAAMQQAEYGDYENKLADWQAKLKPLQELTQAEREENIYNRSGMANALRNMEYDKRLEETARANRAREAANEERIGLERTKVQIQQENAKHPNYAKVVTESGQIVYVNPKDPTDQYWSDLWMPKQSSKMDLLDAGINGRVRVQALRDAQAMARVHAAGSEARLTEADKAFDANEREVIHGEQARQTKATPSGGVAAGAKPPTATQQKVNAYNVAEQALREHQEWTPYITLKQGNTFTIAPPTGIRRPLGPTDNDKQVIKDINKYFDDHGATIPAATQSTTSTTTPPKQTTTTPPKPADQGVAVTGIIEMKRTK